jgi:hypothetical protein
VAPAGQQKSGAEKPEASGISEHRCSLAIMADGLSERYRDLLTGSYDCVDRIVLNAYFRMGHDLGGFRLWWRQLTGSDDPL